MAKIDIILTTIVLLIPLNSRQINGTAALELGSFSGFCSVINSLLEILKNRLTKERSKKIWELMNQRMVL